MSEVELAARAALRLGAAVTVDDAGAVMIGDALAGVVDDDAAARLIFFGGTLRSKPYTLAATESIRIAVDGSAPQTVTFNAPA